MVGNVDEVRLVKERDGTSKGFAYVQFQNVEAMEKAIKMDRFMFKGRQMLISKSIDKPKVKNMLLPRSTLMKKKINTISTAKFEAGEEKSNDQFRQFLNPHSNEDNKTTPE